MKKLVPFFIVYFIALIIGVIAMVYTEKGGVIMLLNGQRTPLLDQVFIFLSLAVEVPIFIGLAFLFLFKNYRASLQIGAAGLLTLITTTTLKALFAHPRPMQYFQEIDKIDLIQLIPTSPPYLGLTSFPSGHTTAAFAMMLSMALIFDKKWVTVTCALMAVGTAISRIYLVNHFVEDVLAGSLLGIGLAMIIHASLEYLKVPAWKSIIKKHRNQS